MLCTNGGVVTGDILIQLARLQELGITHIVCVKHPGKDVFIRANFPEHFRYLLRYADEIFLISLESNRRILLSILLLTCNVCKT